MKLDRKGVEAASNWFNANFNGLPGTGSLATGIITAYLTAIGETHVLVPREPTRQMYAAWMTDHRDWSARYAAMLAAAKDGE